jgi:hypothetical protein
VAVAQAGQPGAASLGQTVCSFQQYNEHHGGDLEGVEHGVLAAGQAAAGRPDLADRFEDLLQQLKLGGAKGLCSD